MYLSIHPCLLLDDPFWNAVHILHGNPFVECRNNIKVVRIFTSSTFTGRCKFEAYSYKIWYCYGMISMRPFLYMLY